MPKKRKFLVKDKKSEYGYLFYDAESKEFELQINKDVDLKSSPILISMFAEENMFNLDPEWSMRWVKQRIIPPNRQNINTILSSNGMTKYDELQMLLYTGGKCCQDDMYIEEIT